MIYLNFKPLSSHDFRMDIRGKIYNLKWSLKKLAWKKMYHSSSHRGANRSYFDLIRLVSKIFANKIKLKLIKNKESVLRVFFWIILGSPTTYIIEWLLNGGARKQLCCFYRLFFSQRPYSLTLIYIPKKSGLTGLTLKSKRWGRLWAFFS
jgi:hypothetical protein